MSVPDVAGESSEPTVPGSITERNSAVFRTDAVHPAPNSQRTGSAEVGIDRIYTAPASDQVEFLGHLPVDIPFIAADELVTIADGGHDIAAGTGRSFHELVHGHVLPHGVKATDGEG